MKKILLMAAFAVATLSANAQVWVGGALGFNYENTKDVKKVTSFNIAPEVGYNLDENWAIALSLDFGYANHKPEIGDSYGVTDFTVAPYVRYTFARAGVANFFLDGGFGIGTSKVEDQDANTNWHIGIRPGVAFNITDHVSFVGTTGFLGYRHQDAAHDINSFGFNANNQLLSVGFYYTF